MFLVLKVLCCETMFMTVSRRTLNAISSFFMTLEKTDKINPLNMTIFVFFKEKNKVVPVCFLNFSH